MARSRTPRTFESDAYQAPRTYGCFAELADQMACYIPEDTKPARAWKALLALVADQISVIQKDILKRGGIVRPYFARLARGKTTTVAKLAARAAMEYGADNAALGDNRHISYRCT